MSNGDDQKSESFGTHMPAKKKTKPKAAAKKTASKGMKKKAAKKR